MCGITGLIDFQGAPISREVVLSAARTIEHRGPDNLDTWTRRNVGLGHARLSIVDLASHANQPFCLDDLGLTIVFNGEIYNFKELRQQLESAGQQFKTESDTEVIIRAYAVWGFDCFSRLNGIFAIGIWDENLKTLTLARDRLGVKPLYLCEQGRRLAFGSEIKSVLAGLPDLRRCVPTQALHEFLYFGVSLGGKTMFEGIEQLPPGTVRSWSHDGQLLNDLQFWEYPTKVCNDIDELETIEQTTQHLEQAVARQLTGDVPIGVFLSGGLDSSSITGFAAKNYPGRLKTYSVGFDFAPSSELPLARQVAKQNGTEHHEIQVGGFGLADTVKKLVRCHDQPFSDAANIPLYLLCEQISGDLKVVLQGDGGDELFAGYRRYTTLASPWKFRWLAQLLRIPGLSNRVPWRYRRYLECFLPSRRAERMARLLTLETRSNPPTDVLQDDLRHQVTQSEPFQRYYQIENELQELDDVQAMLGTDMQIILPDVFLEKVDRSTMAHGIEVRVPLLENELVDYVTRLPSRIKAKNGQQKWLLRAAIKDVVPADVLTGKKTGFGVPFSQWMREPLRDLLNDQLNVLIARGVIKRDVVESMTRSHLAGSEEYAFLLWKLLNFGIWMEEYGAVI